MTSLVVTRTRREDVPAIAALIAKYSFRRNESGSVSGSLIPVGERRIYEILEDQEKGAFFSAIDCYTGELAGCVSVVMYGMSNNYEQIVRDINRKLPRHAPAHFRSLRDKPTYDRIAELRSLAVDERYRNHGTGSELIERAKEEAKSRGFPQLYSLVNSNVLSGFEKAGFKRVDTPPQKLLTDCEQCPIIQECIEIPVAANLAV